ncbi:hypothetical protein [Actinomadura sediminis]|uniref:ESX-1 secretion-associated protein n=1 Tax=Actinomadura sediminis TaxID=1038904 RepID=A0ABW3ERN2_9ACTN
MTHDGNRRESLVPDDAATEQAADDLCEAARTLNHVTAEPGGLAGPATVYGVLGAIATVASRFDQTLQQLDRFLSREHREHRLAHDHGALGEVMDAYGRATLHARHLASGLSEAARQAQESINYVHGITPSEDAGPPVSREVVPEPDAEPGVTRRCRGARLKRFHGRGKGA